MSKHTLKHFQFEDGRTTQVAYLDGYHFGDRLLEGVYFKCTIAKRTLKVEFVEPDSAYVQGLNKKRWLQAAKEFAVEQDIFSEKADGSGEQLEAIWG